MSDVDALPTRLRRLGPDVRIAQRLLRSDPAPE